MLEIPTQGPEGLKTLGENLRSIEFLNFVEIFKSLTLTFASP